MKRAECEVMRANDGGNEYFQIFTHLGEFVTYNDTVLGFDLQKLNLVDVESYSIKKQIPDVVLVRKSYPKIRSKRRQRYWKLQHIPKEDGEADMDDGEPAPKPKGKKKKKFG